MAKTLKDFLEGYLKVKSADEQKFIDKHVTAKNPDRNGNGDDVFGASKVKTIDRRKERKGYNPGEDEKVYEELKGGQKKLDKNHNGKLDSEDFKKLRDKGKWASKSYKTADGKWASKDVKEEAEELEELSKATLGSYAHKAKDQLGKAEYRAGVKMGNRHMGAKPDAQERAYNVRANKRHAGLTTAIDKLTKEEAEQIDEKLSAKSPMGTYIKDFKKSDAPQFKGKSAKKRQVMAIAAKLSAERNGKPLRKEERLQNRINDLTETHQRTMMHVFEKLNEDNKSKFLEACDTPEGVEQMLDFAINNRGE